MNDFVIDKVALVKLRKLTFAGFGDCQKALAATNNNFDEAVIWLRKNGIAKASAKFGEKIANEGKIFVEADESGVVLLELNSETDFTANAEPFAQLIKNIGKRILKAKTNSLDDALKLQLDDGISIADAILSLSSITGEKIVLKQMKYVEKSTDESISTYLHHNHKIGGFVKLNKALKPEQIKNLSVHLVANRPAYISPEEVENEWLDKEKSIIEDQMQKENKPENMREIILNKKIEKVIFENCFLTQTFLFDSKKTVKDVLKDLNADLLMAVYFEIGKS